MLPRLMVIPLYKQPLGITITLLLPERENTVSSLRIITQNSWSIGVILLVLLLVFKIFPDPGLHKLRSGTPHLFPAVVK